VLFKSLERNGSVNVQDQGSFGAALRSIRRDLGMSQQDLALTIGSTQRHVSFLESGRSQPTREMIGRLSAELGLGPGWRAALFEASGFNNPYPRRDFTSEEIRVTLDLLEHRVLAHWPFGAFVLDRSWTILRMNAAARAMFAPLFHDDNEPLNLLNVFTSDVFLGLIENWEDCRIALYVRMQKHAHEDESVRRGLEDARDRGLFDGIAEQIGAQTDVPIFLPIRLNTPRGTVQITSLAAELMSVHDALVEGFTIELVVPMNTETEERLLSAVDPE
jgi:transcriptional regulator with XRE-family HTH domain